MSSDVRRVLITGGAGFIGSHLAIHLRQQDPRREIFVFDNLSRLGSQANLPRLEEAGISFIKGDARSPEAIHQTPPVDTIILAAAEPSVQAGMVGSPTPVIETNLVGTMHTLERASLIGARVLLLSTSRVYPIDPINHLPYREAATRFEWVEPMADERPAGWSLEGLTEEFPLSGRRSFYGASKLGAELLLQEYVASGRLAGLINRCGLVAGPWQMARSDQGVIALWVMRHLFRRPLKYTGFGGTGKQVRDCLHVDDLCRLVAIQLDRLERWDGSVYHAAGGHDQSVSLRELTEICQQATGQTIELDPVEATSPVDVRILIMKSQRARSDFGWEPLRRVDETVLDIARWVRQEQDWLERTLA